MDKLKELLKKLNYEDKQKLLEYIISLAPKGNEHNQ